MMFGFSVLFHFHLISRLSRATVLSNLNRVFYIVLFSFSYIKYFFYQIQVKFMRALFRSRQFLPKRTGKTFLDEAGGPTWTGVHNRTAENERITDRLFQQHITMDTDVYCSVETFSGRINYHVSKGGSLNKTKHRTYFTKSWFLNLLVLFCH